MLTETPVVKVYFTDEFKQRLPINIVRLSL